MASVVEALVVFDPHHQPAAPGFALDLQRLGVAQHQRLHGEHVLLVPQGRQDHLVVHLVRHRHHHDLARRELGDDLAVEVRVRLVRVALRRIGLEGLPGEGAGQHLRFGERADGLPVEGADADAADPPLPLHLVERGQQLIVGDHAPADDQNLEAGHYATAARARTASANACSKASSPSRRAASEIISGGEILTVPPP